MPRINAQKRERVLQLGVTLDANEPASVLGGCLAWPQTVLTTDSAA